MATLVVHEAQSDSIILVVLTSTEIVQCASHLPVTIGGYERIV